MRYKWNGIQITIPAGFSVVIDKLILKFIWNYKGPRRAKPIFNRKNKIKGLCLPDIKAYYKTPIIKAVCLCNTKIGQKAGHSGAYL